MLEDKKIIVPSDPSDLEDADFMEEEIDEGWGYDQNLNAPYASLEYDLKLLKYYLDDSDEKTEIYVNEETGIALELNRVDKTVDKYFEDVENDNTGKIDLTDEEKFIFRKFGYLPDDNDTNKADISLEFDEDDDIEYEDLSAEEANRLSEEMLEESIRIRNSIVYDETSVETEVSYVELRSPDDENESPLKRKVKELVNKGHYERKVFIDYLDGDSEQARKMINTYPKKKDFKMEEFIMWINFLDYDIKVIKDPDRYVLGELKQTDGDDKIVTFENNKDFIPIKQLLVELINSSNLKVSNIKFFYSEKPSNTYNIIERFKKNNTMTTDTFALWLTLIGYTIKLVKREGAI